MATLVRKAAHAVLKSSTSSPSSAQTEARRDDEGPEARRDDEGPAGPSTPGGCQPRADSASENGSGSEEADPFTPAKRLKYAKDGAVKFEMVDRKCFQGGFLRKETVLDTKMFGGTGMIKRFRGGKIGCVRQPPASRRGEAPSRRECCKPNRNSSRLLSTQPVRPGRER